MVDSKLPTSSRLLVPELAQLSCLPHLPHLSLLAYFPRHRALALLEHAPCHPQLQLQELPQSLQAPASPLVMEPGPETELWGHMDPAAYREVS